MMAATNKLDTTVLGIEIAIAVAEAPFDELQFQSHRLAEMVEAGTVEKQRAVDILFAAATAADMRRVHGGDFVQELISAGFEVAA